jgi:hypothetical protein
VGAHTTRAASVVLAVVLSGTPALLAACAVLCVPATSHAAEGESQHSSPCCVAERETPAGHAHHGTPAESAGPRVAPDEATRMIATDGSCCPDGQSLAVAAAAMTRVDTGLLVAPPIAALALAVARPASTTASADRLHAPLRSPARPPLVLRI